MAEQWTQVNTPVLDNDFRPAFGFGHGQFGHTQFGHAVATEGET